MATPAPCVQAMQDDPRVGVVMAFALPFLSLSFGYTPSEADLDAGGQGRVPAAWADEGGCCPHPTSRLMLLHG